MRRLIKLALACGRADWIRFGQEVSGVEHAYIQALGEPVGADRDDLSRAVAGFALARFHGGAKVGMKDFLPDFRTPAQRRRDDIEKVRRMQEKRKKRSVENGV